MKIYNPIFTTMKTKIFPMILFSRSLKQYCFTVLLCLITLQLYAQKPVTEGQWYVIESYKKSRVLQVQTPYQNNGIAVILAKRTNQNNQLFRFEDIGNGFYLIRSKQNNKVFDIRGGSQQNYAVLQVWDQANVENQKFKLNLATANSQYYIVAKHSRKSLVVDAAFPIGSTIKQQQVDGLANAMFKFVPQNPVNPTPKPAKVVLNKPVTGQVITNKVGAIIQFDWKAVANANEYQLLVEHKNKKDKLLNTLTRNSNYQLKLSSPINKTLAKDAWGWWVRAKVGNTWGAWSKPNTVYFKTPPTINNIPKLLKPAANTTLANGMQNNSISYTWYFDWANVPNAQQYEILISHPTNAGKSLRKTVTKSEYKLVQKHHKSSAELLGWSWKVRAIINGSYTNWSISQKFTVHKPKINPTPSVNFVTQSKNSFTKAWKNRHFAKFSNKVNNRKTLTGYDMTSKKFAMNASYQNWRIKSLGNNTYQLQVEVNGKFWSLAAANDRKGNVQIVANNRNDKMQQWQITQQADGYYKITNIGMKLNAYASDDTLFYDGKNNELFVSKWKEGKTVNGRWYFDAKQPINIKPDPLENRTFKMASVVNGKEICMGYVWTSDATGYNTLGFCNSNNSRTIFRFEKTIYGNYLIKIKKSEDHNNKWNYLSNNFELQEIDYYKDAPISKNYSLYWKLIPRGNRQYAIVEVDTNKAIELIQHASGFPREFIELKSFANKRTQYFKLY